MISIENFDHDPDDVFDIMKIRGNGNKENASNIHYLVE